MRTETNQDMQTIITEGKPMKSMQRNFRRLGLASVVGLGLAYAMTSRADTVSAGDPGHPPQGPANPGRMTPPEQASKSDPMAQYQQLGKANDAQGRPAAAATVQAGTAASGHKHLHCVFKIKPDGSYRLERAVEVDGDPLVSEEAAGPIITEVSKGSDVVSIQAHVDPFEQRGFSSQPGQGPKGHHFQSAEEGEVVVKIPQASLADTDLDKLSVRFYRWQGSEALEHVDGENFKEYKRLNRVRGFSEVPGSVLGKELRSKGTVAPR